RGVCGPSRDGGAATDLAIGLPPAEVGVPDLELNRSVALLADEHLAHVIALAAVLQRELRVGIDPRGKDLAAGVAPHANVDAAVGGTSRRGRATAAAKQTPEPLEHL